ncbi:MAG: aspartate--ammonia ligase [Clostridia bacterium]|nr:aspartate--ammonia ligase [Clostridia bacterium]
MSRNIVMPDGYTSVLTLRETEKAIKFAKDRFENHLAEALNLERVSAPMFVTKESGFNDNLNGVERPVEFDLLETGTWVQVVHSLAKWKRFALYKYGFEHGCGLYTDMNAIRRDEELDNIHSIYVDQWDWERVIKDEERTTEFLYDIVRRIIKALKKTETELLALFPKLKSTVCEEVFFIDTQTLADMYPGLTAKERENAITKEKKTVFISKIGGKLRNGEKHDGRAPDYDDWELNGDILVWNDVLGSAFEISSMGIRVNKESLLRQLEIAGCQDRAELTFHRMLLEDKLPLTIGGGIGQSRLCMLLLGKAHIGEVQSAVWPESMIEELSKHGINLL